MRHLHEFSVGRTNNCKMTTWQPSTVSFQRIWVMKKISVVESLNLPAADQLGEDLVNEEDDESAGKDDPETCGRRQKVEVRCIF